MKVKNFFSKLKSKQKGEEFIFYVIQKFRWDWLYFDYIYAYNHKRKFFDKISSLETKVSNFWTKEDIDLEEIQMAYKKKFFKEWK